jgi:hypothetical protein
VFAGRYDRLAFGIAVDMSHEDLTLLRRAPGPSDVEIDESVDTATTTLH